MELVKQKATDLVFGTGPRHLGSTEVSSEGVGSNSIKELSLAERGKHAISTNWLIFLLCPSNTKSFSYFQNKLTSSPT